MPSEGERPAFRRSVAGPRYQANGPALQAFRNDVLCDGLQLLNQTQQSRWVPRRPEKGFCDTPTYLSRKLIGRVRPLVVGKPLLRWLGPSGEAPCSEANQSYRPRLVPMPPHQRGGAGRQGLRLVRGCRQLHLPCHGLPVRISKLDRDFFGPEALLPQAPRDLPRLGLELLPEHL